MHDDQQIVRLYQLDKALSDGHFPARWVADLGFGYGYPLFVFYPPLIYYLGWVYHLVLSLSYIDAMKLVFATSFVGAAMAMFYWCRYHFGTWAGIVGALFYTYAPYRSVDAYVRGALAEAFSFVWLPLILLSIDKIRDRLILVPEIKLTSEVYVHPTRAQVVKQFVTRQIRQLQANRLWIISLGLTYGLLMITHNLITLPFSLLMIVYYLFSLTRLTYTRWFDFTSQLLIAGAIGLGLSAFFWIPALVEKQHTIVDDILLEERYDYTLHFVYPDQLWNSLWGYGGSTEGRLDGMSYKIGKLHLIISLFMGLSAGLILLTKTINRTKLTTNVFAYWRKFDDQATTSMGLALMLALSIAMTLEISRPIWEGLYPLQFLQFPWRFLTFTTLFSSALVAASVPLVVLIWKQLWQLQLFSRLRQYDPIRFQILSVFAPHLGILIGLYYVFLLITLLFVPNLKLFQPQTHLDVSDAYYTNQEFVSWNISKTSFEFVPQGVETTTQEDLNITQLAISAEDIAQQTVELLNGTAVYELTLDQTHKKRLQIEAETISQIQFNVFNFPGWRLYRDNEPININDDNRLHLITTLVPEGAHEFLLHFENTPVRHLANQITTMTLGLLLGYLMLPTIIRQTYKNSKS